MTNNKNKDKLPTPEELIKYEIAEELGLIDKIRKYGWKSLSSKESGRIGGLVANRKAKKEIKDNIKK